MQVRRAQTSDQGGIEAVVAAAFVTHPEQVVEMVRALDASGATRVSLVCVDDAVIGHVQLSRGWIDARCSLVDALVLSPLSVMPERQRQGIGKELVAVALREAQRLAMPAVFLEGDPRYYLNCGFAPAVELGFTPPSTRIPPPAFQVVLLPAHEKWMTGQLVYPEAFWSTDTVGLRDPGLAEIEASFAENSGR